VKDFTLYEPPLPAFNGTHLLRRSGAPSPRHKFQKGLQVPTAPLLPYFVVVAQRRASARERRSGPRHLSGQSPKARASASALLRRT
jgi:hypothetical protein